jgi:Kdo-III transferase WaaZ
VAVPNHWRVAAVPNKTLQRIGKRIWRPIWEHVYPRTYWHMRHFDRRFGITWREGRAEVTWREQRVAESLSIHEAPRATGSLAIIGSGPSLLTTPDKAWQGRDVCCVNGSILWARQKNIRPQLYVVADPGFAQRRLDVISLALEHADTTCVSLRCLFEILRQRSTFFQTRRVLVYKNINQPYGRPLYTEEELRKSPLVMLDGRVFQGRYIGFSGDPNLGFFPCGTVALSAAQLAIAMGYKDLQFVGLDMKQKASAKRFYVERKPEPSFIDKNFEILILPSFVLLRRFCDNYGVTIHNWSPDSAVPRDILPFAMNEETLLGAVA